MIVVHQPTPSILRQLLLPLLGSCSVVVSAQAIQTYAFPKPVPFTCLLTSIEAEVAVVPRDALCKDLPSITTAASAPLSVAGAMVCPCHYACELGGTCVAVSELTCTC